MWKIIQLDKNLANQIAAGEVVERPVSVIKELVENSIDARATQIKIEIENGGIDMIIVSDNGTGIEKDDLPLTIEKYSTSKISNLDDLYNVMTFGFRWEALASISSVSDFAIESRIDSSVSGYSLEMLSGELQWISEVWAEVGTKIIVKDLFHNTPARLNYLKKPRTEYAHILEFLNKIALAYPEIGFEFISDGKTVYKYNAGEDLKTRIYAIYGEQFFENVLDIDFQFSGLHITGYVSDPKISFPNKNRQSLLVNKRAIKSPLIYKAISNAYNRFIPHGMYPGYVLNIQVDPTQIDVNVHPRKLEVRFAAESNVFRAFYNAIESKLDDVSLISGDVISENSSQVSSNTPEQEKYYTGSGTKFKSYSPYKNTTANPQQRTMDDAMLFSKAMMWSSFEDESTSHDFETSNDLHDTPLGRIIGQTFNSYIIVQTRDTIQILDQHALAERIIYEKLIANDYTPQVQNLLIGQSFQLTPKEFAVLDEHKEVFDDIWFDIEVMSGGIVMLNGIPDFIKKEDLESTFLWILEDIWENPHVKSKTLQEVRNTLFAYTSCRAAIKFGHKLTLFEMNKLLHDAALDYSATCPHGRPVIYEINLEDLKNKYER